MLINKERVKSIFRNNQIQLVDIIVILDDICNADCNLCVAKHVIKNKTCKDICSGYKPECLKCCGRTIDDNTFYKEIEDIFSVVNGPNVRITLSGGEPTLSPRLVPVFEILDKYKFFELNIETNGAGLLNEVVAEALKSRNVNIILSRYGISDKENNAEFCFRYSPVTEQMTKDIISTYGSKVTVSCILLKNAVSTADKLIEYFDYYVGLGAIDAVFNEAMFDVTLSDANKDISEYYNKNAVKAADLSRQLELIGINKTLDIGEAFKIIKHNYQGREITLTAVDISKAVTESKNDANYSRYLIYPSGEIGANYVEDR